MQVQRLASLVIMIATCLGLAPSVAKSEIIVRMETNLGYIDIELFDETAPLTVANFLNYVHDGDYDNSFIHRSATDFLGRPFIIQGGGYRYFNSTFEKVPQDPPVVNEFDPSDPDRSNLRGTIAMAKLPSDPDSATSEWFFNMGDNSGNLDYQNGGFTVFGKVYQSNTDNLVDNDGPSMQLVDVIAALPRFNGAGLDSRYDYAWTEMPVVGLSPGQTFDASQNLVMIQSMRETNYLKRVTSQAGNNVAITVPSPARLANLTALPNPDPASTPPGVDFAEGFFSFQVTGLTPGSSTMVAMQLPSNYLPNTYFMFGPTPDNASPHWYEFKFDGQTGAEFFNNNAIVLHFVDGQRGDADLTANGQITDPGAPGIGPEPVSSGGGCTFAPHTHQTSIVIDYWLMLLALFGYRIYKHRSEILHDALPSMHHNPTESCTDVLIAH